MPINESAKNQQCWLEISIQPWAKHIFTECSYQARIVQYTKHILSVCIKWTYETWVQALAPGPRSAYFSPIFRGCQIFIGPFTAGQELFSRASVASAWHATPPAGLHLPPAMPPTPSSAAVLPVPVPPSACHMIKFQSSPTGLKSPFSDKWLVLVCRRIPLLNYGSFNAG